MKTLDYEVNRIHNELADLGCQMMFGMSCFELVEELRKTLEHRLRNDNKRLARNIIAPQLFNMGADD